MSEIKQSKSIFDRFTFEDFPSKDVVQLLNLYYKEEALQRMMDAVADVAEELSTMGWEAAAEIRQKLTTLEWLLVETERSRNLYPTLPGLYRS